MRDRIKLGVHEVEEEFLKDVAYEQVETFGNDHVRFYILDDVASSEIHDPLYGEPTEYSYKYKLYETKGNYHDYSSTETAGEGGEYTEWTQTLDVAVKHLEEAGIEKGHPITGDVVAIKTKGSYLYFDIIQYEDDGVMSQTGFHTSVIFDLKLNTKFDPSRIVFDND